MKKALLILAFLALGFTGWAQTVRGKVMSADDNAPLPGVNVIVQGTTKGTTTDASGIYSIDLDPSENVLVFSFVGFTTFTAQVNGRTTLDVVLQSDITSLGEIIVVGYGTQRKVDVTGSISSVDSDDITRQSALTATQAIQGKVAGVNIINNDQPGATPTVIVRGLGTALSGREPLYIVDGIPVNNITHISPSDILKIDILKDASSASIYGLRAANGVIIITTKKGESGKPKVGFDSYYGIKSTLNAVKMANAGQYITYFNEESAASGGYLLGESQQYDTDWYDELIQTGSVSNTTFSVSGGGENTTYFLSYNHYQEEGLLEDQKYRRGTIRNNNTYSVFDNRLNITQNLNISYSKEDPKPLGAFNSAYRQSPLVPVFYDNGRWGQPFVNQTTGEVTYIAGTGESIGKLNSTGNPVSAVYYQNEERRTVNLQGGITAEFSITDYLKATTRFGGTKYYYDRTTYDPLREEWIAADPTRTTEEFETERENATDANGVIPATWAYNSLVIEDVETYRWNWDGFLTFDKSIGSHNVNIVLGGSKEEVTVGKRLYGLAYDVPEKEQYWSINHASGDFDNVVENIYYTPTTLLSYFGRLQYNFENTYYLTATLRRDGSSVFKEGENFWENFPSFGLGWTISNEEFMQNADFLTFLKVRGNWGRLGNQSVPFNTSQILTNSGVNNNNYNYALGPNQELIFGASAASPAEDVAWEVVEEWGLGLDFEFLNGRLSGNIDYYDKRTKNLILLVRPVLSSQFSESFYDHGAEVSNKGLELALAWKDQLTDDLSYNIGINFSHNANKVENVAPAYDGMTGGSLANGEITKRLQEGQPLGAWWMYEVEGVWQNQEEIDNNTSVGGAAPGYLRYKDQNEDGVIDDRDKKFFGSYIPKYNFGISLGLDYKNFDLSIDGFGLGGNKVYNGLKNARLGGENITAETFNTRWTGEGSTNSHPGAERDYLASSYYLEDGDYFRVNNITLGYTFNTFSQFITRLRVYFTAQNPVMLTGYSGFTPELIGVYEDNQYGSRNVGNPYGTSGVELTAYPNTRTFLFGINLQL